MATKLKKSVFPKLSIIILNWNTKELLQQCVESITKQWTTAKGRLFPAELIIVDNASTDGSVDYIKELTKLRIIGLKIKGIFNQENLGYAKGNNIGIKTAQGEYLLILNSDTIVKNNALTKLVNFLDKNPDIDIVGPKLLNKDGTYQPNCGRFPDLLTVFIMLFAEHFKNSRLVRFSPSKTQEVDWLMGAAFLARKKVFAKIGGFDENIFMYMEEVEWFYRAHMGGFKAFFFDEAQIIHLGQGSSKTGRTEPILNIYKGIIYFYQKHKNPFELLILKMLLKTKAFLALILGYLTNNNYLKKTYGQAFKIH